MISKIIYILEHNRVLMHSLFWLSTLLIYPIYALGFGQPFYASFLVKLFALPVQIVATYSLVSYLIPHYIYKKKYLRFLLLFSVSVLFFCTAAHLIEDYLNPKFLTGYNDIHSVSYILTNPFANVGYQGSHVYLTVFLVATIKIIKDRFEEKKQVTLLQKEKAEAELNLLKAQINPRILTKSLRQLHQLSLQQSDQAPEVVLKLSEMLDYMLYQCNDPKVNLDKELVLLQNYLDIEQIRYGDHLSIDFKKDIHTKEINIAPLLLLSLVETAFQKKTVKKSKEKVILEISERAQQITCLVQSTIMDTPNVVPIKQQLNLLYKDRHILTVDNNTLHLTIDLCPIPLNV